MSLGGGIAASDTLVSMMSRDLIDQRVHDEMTGVSHGVVQGDDVPHARLRKRHFGRFSRCGLDRCVMRVVHEAERQNVQEL